MSKLNQLAQLGQAVWLDYIRRAFLEDGELKNLVGQGVRGLTSNPTIFEKAIAGSNDYDTDLRTLVQEGKSVAQIYEALAFEDIRRAADTLRPVYDQTDGGDGYVSLEVSPTLAHDTQGTLAEAVRLFSALSRPNLMIKIPATAAGIPAIRAAIRQGVNVNVTLIFSLAQYEAVAEAYIAGLEDLASSGGNPAGVASVASFFVSRIDTAIDRLLQEHQADDLLGKIAVASAKVTYARFKEIFSGERWEKLVARGARPQRPLWASTGTKNPAYSDTLYVDHLIGPHTVNTLPPATLEAFLDHGQVALSLEADLDQAHAQLARLAELGIDLDSVTKQLQDAGVTAFAKSFEDLMSSIAARREALLAEKRTFFANLRQGQSGVEMALAQMGQENVIARIWAHDHTLWKPEPKEITNRLGWLHIAEAMQAALPELQSLAQAVRADGYSHALLLGMGGSSLAPQVLRKTFGVQPGYLDLAVLDSTDPGAVLAYAQQLDPARTLYIVSTKSGGTVETLSFFKYFYNQVAEALGAKRAGAHFIAITDPGSKLAEVAAEYKFRKTFLNDPNIGGRYSALSYFGLLPAALIGLNLSALLARALEMAQRCQNDVLPSDPAQTNNPGAQLGAILGALAHAGHDKVTLITSPDICTFGDWVEQLIAESTGKEGKGILPVVGEVIGEPEVYGPDRLFIYLRMAGDHTHDAGILALEHAGHPVVHLEIEDRYDLGGQFFLWEMATAVAGHILGINPFNQSNVESAKVLARQMVATYQEQGKLPELQPVLRDGRINVYADFQTDNLSGALKSFLAQAQPGAYVSLQAYIQPSHECDAALLELRTRLRQATRLAVTSGYGPRFLHSTGQLHKGDAGKGLFIQVTSESPQDAAIPDRAGASASSIRFGVLKLAQALGDRQALLDAGRKVIRFHIEGDVLIGLTRLTKSI